MREIFEPCKVKAVVHTTGKIREVFIVKFEDASHCKAIVDNQLCTAIYNGITGLFYVDNKYGVLDTLEV